MGVSVYVMPLHTWVSGDFTTTWETREEAAGMPGLRITPEGLAGPVPPRKRREKEVAAAIGDFRKRVGSFVTAPLEWDEESPFRSATTMSYSSYGSPRRRAQQWAYKVNLPRLQAMEAPQLWLPVPFEPTIRIIAPWNEDSEIRVVSSRGLLTELDKLAKLMTADPLMEELKAWPGDTALSGEVAAFDSELDATTRLRRIANSSLEHRVPVIVEG